MGTFYIHNDEKYAGKFFWTEKRARISGVFSYDEEYVSGKSNWNIDPALSMTAGAQVVKHGLPGALRDAAPDRWGRSLIRHRYLRELRTDTTKKSRTLNDVDYLLGVSDFSRQGSLRFSLNNKDGFLHPDGDCPKLVSLPKLLNAANSFAESDDEGAIIYLLDAGSASLGGARPKAAILDGENLYIAKFPHRQDKWDVMAWEWVSLRIAEEAGIRVPTNRLIKIEGQNVLLIKRFDRKGVERLGYISAMTLLNLTDGDQADYSEIAESLRDVSVSAKADLEELYRRIVLSLLLNNTDDHLRNHGFLRSGCGWILSPVFDVNPDPDIAGIRATSVFFETERKAALAALIANSIVFDLTEQQASRINREVESAVKSCETLAVQADIPKGEREMMMRALCLK